jgi:hypothetical protein
MSAGRAAMSPVQHVRCPATFGWLRPTSSCEACNNLGGRKRRGLGQGTLGVWGAYAKVEVGFTNLHVAKDPVT